MKETDAQMITREGVLPISKEFDSSSVLLALGADGASVMSGCNEGVTAKLEKTYPWLIYIHCAAHRLNLIVVAYFCKVNAASAVIKLTNHCIPSSMLQVTINTMVRRYQAILVSPSKDQRHKLRPIKRCSRLIP